jgi:hypothetical protein
MAKEQKMAEKTTAPKIEAPKPVEAPKPEENGVKISEVKLKQNVLNLENGEEVEVEFLQKRYTADKANGVTLEAARQIVGSVENQIKAFLDFATSRSYQDSRNAALAKGTFLTAELRSKIVVFMRAQANFADLSAKDAFNRWKDGFLAGKAGAKKILDLVTASGDEFSDL